VIGGGPAGLSASIAVSIKGFDVTVIDSARPPIDKACGEGILPAGVDILRRLGVRIPKDDGFALRGIRFLSDGVSVEAPFPSGTGLALRRTRLHECLIERATELGVRLLWSRRATDVSAASSFEWIVGADGQNSRIRSAAGLDDPGRRSYRVGFRRHYRVSPWTDFVEVHWGSRCQIYITPVSPNEMGVAVLSRDSHTRLEDALIEFPVLQRRLAGVRACSMERGAMTASRCLRHVVHGNTALAGDASGSVDAITGDGLSLAFQEAVALADALATGDLRRYETAHRRLMRHPAMLARVLLLLDRFPALRRTVMRLLVWEPAVFGRALAEHGAISAGARG